MQTNTPEEIRQAQEYLTSGKANLARPILFTYLKQNPDSEQGWFLLSHAVFDPDQRADCLRQVLRINPNNKDARQRLDFMLETKSEAERSGPEIQDTSTELITEHSEPAEEQVVPSDQIDQSDILDQTTSQPKKPSEKRKKKRNIFLPILIVVLSIIVLLLCAVAGYLAFTFLVSPQFISAASTLTQPTEFTAIQPSETPTKNPTASPTIYQLPPTWTPSATPTITPTPTITSTPVPSITPTFVEPAETVQTQMDQIQEQVSELRGLPIVADVSRYIVLPGNIEEMLRVELTNNDYIPKLEKRQRVLTVLGLIDPSYDLVRFAMNHLVDNIGGFYRPVKKDIYVIGTRFGGIERFVYSHEYDHALTDQYFDFVGMGIEDCDQNNDRCDALRALIEGDASLAMGIWLNTYATERDYSDIIRYRPPNLALPDEKAPEYAIQSVNFPYIHGVLFVETLYKLGAWERVNQAYYQPPETSEQVLHPEKYIAGEAPLPLLVSPLESILGDPWQKIADDVLGEWTTYLILAYGADEIARQDDALAKRAAEGWGADRYQVFYSSEDNQSVLAAHWRWDRVSDAQEFDQAMQDYLEKRYKGVRFDYPGSVCWGTTGDISCLRTQEDETLWLIVPDQELLDKILLIYPNFQ